MNEEDERIIERNLAKKPHETLEMTKVRRRTFFIIYNKTKNINLALKHAEISVNRKFLKTIYPEYVMVEHEMLLN